MNQRIVKKRDDGLRLVTWTAKDLSHYGITNEQGALLEVFTPTKDCKGNQLRAKAFEIFEKTSLDMYEDVNTTLTTDALEVDIGHVLGWVKNKSGDESHMLVTGLSEYFVWGELASDNSFTGFTIETVAHHLQNGIMWVCEFDTLSPEVQYNFSIATVEKLF